MRAKVVTVLAGWLAVTVGATAIARGAVALPEHCGNATAANVEQAIGATVAWWEHNQRPDGTWLYRYDVQTNRDLGTYSWVRHAGALLGLYQAASAGEAGALASADRGLSVAVNADLVRGDTWAALREQDSLSTGGTALLAAALGERRDATGDQTNDALLLQLGTYLARQVSSEGQVWETAAPDGTSVVGSVSPFTTGEDFFALARLHRLFPGHGFDAAALRIARYVIAERADREGFVPDMSDHWSAYAFAEVRRWPERSAAGLTADELGWARRQMGILSIETRWETQRTNHGLSQLLRGRRALGAAIGTIGEAMGQWWQVGAQEPALDRYRSGLHDRLRCMAGAIVDRQVSPLEAQSTPDPTRSAGAWFQFGITQMDDQQHTLSALVAAERILKAPTPLPRRSPIPTNVWLLLAAVVLALNPLRLAAGADGERRARARAVGVAGAVTIGVTGLLAIVGGPLLRALDVSAGNGLVAAAVVLVGGGLYCLSAPDEAEPGGLLVPLIVPLGLRPDLLLLAVAVGAGGRGWIFGAGVAAGCAIAVGLAWTAWEPTPTVYRWLMRLLGMLATATAIALVVDGVYSI